MSKKLRRLASIVLVLSMLIAVLGTVAVYADGMEDYDGFTVPSFILPDLGLDSHLLSRHETFYQNNQVDYSYDEQYEYTFFTNGQIKTEKSTHTFSQTSNKTIYETVYNEDGSIAKATYTTIQNGQTTVKEMGTDNGYAESISDEDAVITTDSEGRITSIKYDNEETKMTYDANGNLTSQSTYSSSGTLMYGFSWTYDAAGNRKTETVDTGMGGWTYSFTYDSNNRLSGYDYTSGAGRCHATYQYAQSGDSLTVTAEIYDVTGGKQDLIEKAVCEYQYIDSMPFIDVPKNEYYYDAVKWASSAGVTNGTTSTTFSPEENCTRAQIVTFLWRYAGCPEPKSSSCPFTDVKPDTYYYKAVLWAYENKITNGTSDTEFSPEESCIRAQAVTFIWRFELSAAPKSSNNPFTDVKPDTYYYDAVLWAVENGVTKGTTTTTFSPDETCTRGQIVTFLYRLA